MQLSSYLIYGLVDPRNNEMRYIGKSSSGLRRPSRHWSAKSLRLDRNGHKVNWLKQVLADGLEPRILVLERLECQEDLNAAEMAAISYYRSIGCKLTNILLGGNGFTSATARAAFNRRSKSSVRKSGKRLKEYCDRTGIRQQNNLRLRKPILAINKLSGEQRWYLSASHAAADGLGSRSAISNCLRPGWRCKHNKGWSFQFVTAVGNPLTQRNQNARL